MAEEQPRDFERDGVDIAWAKVTTLGSTVVDAFGIPIEQVRVVLGDTDRGDGFGSAGSRSIRRAILARRRRPVILPSRRSPCAFVTWKRS